MKTKTTLTLIASALMFWAWPSPAQVRVLQERAVTTMLDTLEEIDFEDLPLLGLPRPGMPRPSLPNPLVLEDLTVKNPGPLVNGFCAPPTCTPDPDNADGGNIVLFLDPGGEISFPQTPKVVVVDIQGIGDNPFFLVVTDKRGRSIRVAGRGKLFGVTLIGMTAPSGISSVKVESVGGTGGPLVLTRVLFRGHGH